MFVVGPKPFWVTAPRLQRLFRPQDPLPYLISVYSHNIKKEFIQPAKNGNNILKQYLIYICFKFNLKFYFNSVNFKKIFKMVDGLNKVIPTFYCPVKYHLVGAFKSLQLRESIGAQLREWLLLKKLNDCTETTFNQM